MFCVQVPGCETSAMMQAFSEFMLREMGIEQHEFNVCCLCVCVRTCVRAYVRACVCV